MSEFKTTAVYLSGGVCGPIWWPAGAMCGRPLRVNARGHWGFYQDGNTFEEALSSLLMKEGGDFQHAQFTADTVIRIERTTSRCGGKYQVHVKEIEVAKIAPDLVNSEHYVGDFIGDE